MLKLDNINLLNILTMIALIHGPVYGISSYNPLSGKGKG